MEDIVTSNTIPLITSSIYAHDYFKRKKEEEEKREAKKVKRNWVRMRKKG
ncbi:MAG: hypothetical protein LBL71_01165 [Endomicrobium sp.]|jgi:hypothetical protein|nr:hypothetical protein [Endomicrobium sp.]